MESIDALSMRLDRVEAFREMNAVTMGTLGRSEIFFVLQLAQTRLRKPERNVLETERMNLPRTEEVRRALRTVGLDADMGLDEATVRAAIERIIREAMGKLVGRTAPKIAIPGVLPSESDMRLRIEELRHGTEMLEAPHMRRSNRVETNLPSHAPSLLKQRLHGYGHGQSADLKALVNNMAWHRSRMALLESAIRGNATTRRSAHATVCDALRAYQESD